MSVDVGSAVGYLDLDISGFLSGLRTAQAEADSKSKNIAAKIGNNISGVGKSLTSAGKTLTSAVTVPVAGAGAAIIKMSSSFESAMSRVQAISGATGDDLTALNKKAQELGATTAFSASEVADGMTEMAKAGWNAGQIIDGMEGVLNAASASGENLANVSTIVADAITGFGMEAKEATKVADLLTQAANSGTIDINDLGESFKYIAPVASTMGFSIEEVTTAIAAMSKAGIKGSQAGTSLRTMLTRMVKPTDQVAAAMGELDIKLTEQDGSFKSLNKITSEMREKFANMTDEQKAYYATILAGQEGMSGLLSILNLTQEEYDEISKSMDNANGIAKETADVMLDNLKGQVTILKSSLEGLAIQLGEVILPYLKRFVEWVQNLVIKFQNLTPEQKEQIVKWAAFAAAIGPVLFVIGKLIAGVGNMITTFSKVPGIIDKVKTGFGAMKVALAGVSAPVIAIIAVVAVLTAAFVNLWKNNEEFRNKITAIWEQVKATFEKLTSGIVERLNKLGFDFENIGEVLKAIWKGFCDFLAPIFEGAFQYVADIFDTVVNIILGTIDFFIALFKGDWEGCWNAVKEIFESIWNGIKDWFTNTLNVIKGIFDAILGWFGTSWSKCWNSIKTFFVDIWNGIKTTASNVWNSIKSTASNVWNGIKTAATNTWNGIKNAIMNPIDAAKNGIKKAIDAIKGFFNFKISWPKIPLPHFKIRPSGWGVGDLLKGTIPKLSIDWYAKAMNNGMILNGATIFGMDKNGNLLGGGESGSETVVGTKSLLRMIKRAVYEAVGPLVMASRELAKASAELGYVTYNGFAKLNEHRGGNDEAGQRDNNSGGDTFIFNSPKAIDEIEAAKQMKKTKRELAEGF